MKRPLVSIITICYNEKKIEKTCLSIVNQTFQNFEWIVIDGQSTDGITLKILDKYRDKINIFISEKDNGRYDAMNKGISKASGQWIIFMNGGDSFYDCNVLDTVFANRIYKGIDILYGNPLVFIKDYSFLKTLPAKLSFSFFCDNALNHQSCFIHKRVFQKYGLYSTEFTIVGDVEKCLKCLEKKCTFYPLGTTIANYDGSGISSFSGQYQLHKSEKIRVLQKYAHIEKDDYLKNIIYTIRPQVSLKNYIKQVLYRMFSK